MEFNTPSKDMVDFFLKNTGSGQKESAEFWGHIVNNPEIRTPAWMKAPAEKTRGGPGSTTGPLRVSLTLGSPRTREELWATQQVRAGVWTPALIAAAGSRPPLYQLGTDMVGPAAAGSVSKCGVPPSHTKYMTDTLRRQLTMVEDGCDGEMRYAVAPPRVNVQLQGTFMYVWWETIVSTWGEPTPGETTEELVDRLDVLPEFVGPPSSDDMHPIQQVVYPLGERGTGPVDHTLVGHRYWLKVPGTMKGGRKGKGRGKQLPHLSQSRIKARLRGNLYIS